MKNIGTTIMSIVLSMLIITLSAGISWVHCCHAGTIEWAQFSSSPSPCMANSTTGQGCCKASQGCCHGTHKKDYKGASVKKHGCMESHTLQLDPSQLQTHQHFDFSQAHLLLVSCPAFMNIGPTDAVAEVTHHDIPTGYKSPPRGYLHFIRILRI